MSENHSTQQNQVPDLISRARNHALAMRMHGATLRGPKGAAMLEELCDMVAGRITGPVVMAEPVAKIPHEPGVFAPGCLTVDESMKMLNLTLRRDLANMIGRDPSVLTYWMRNKGCLPVKESEKVRELYRARQVRGAA